MSEPERLIACPSSPDNVVPAREVAGRQIYQDPCSLPVAYPQLTELEPVRINTEMLVPPPRESTPVTLVKGPNIHDLPNVDLEGCWTSELLP